MRIYHSCKILGLTTLLVLSGWVLHRPASLSAEKSVTIHILYSSDAQGYYEPCG